MRVCDRHPRKPATEMIHMESSDASYDLCKSCAEEIDKFISKPRKEGVERKSFWAKKEPA